MNKQRNDLAQALYLLIDRTDDTEGLAALATIVEAHYDLLNAGDAGGLGLDLREWIGLKRDTPAMGAEYGPKVRAAFPDAFE